MSRKVSPIIPLLSGVFLGYFGTISGDMNLSAWHNYSKSGYCTHLYGVATARVFFFFLFYAKKAQYDTKFFTSFIPHRSSDENPTC